MSQESATAVVRSSRAWIAWVAGLAVLAVFTVVSLSVLADLGARTVEMDRLLTAVESSETAMQSAKDQVDAALKPYASGTLTDADKAKIRKELAGIAEQGGPSIAAAGEGVAAVRILPWHTHIVDARQAYLRHNAAWVAYMAAAAEDPQQWFKDQPEVNDTFYAAKAPMEQGVTLFDLANALDRVRQIFADEQDAPADGSGGGQSA